MSQVKTYKASKIIRTASDLARAGRRPEAIEQLLAIPKSDPDYGDACFGLASMYMALEQLDLARSYLDTAIELNPGYALNYNELGTICLAEGKYEDALAYYRKSLSLLPGGRNAEASVFNEEKDSKEIALVRFNLSFARLLHGDFDGFRLYENRLKSMGTGNKNTLGGVFMPSQFSKLARWQGQALAGKRLIVWAEQGLGDNIMMARFFSVLAQQGADVIVHFCIPELAKLFLSVPVIVATDHRMLVIKEFDYHCPIMSLPYLLGITPETLPQQVPYLQPDPTLQALWRKRMRGIGGLRVGLAWAGGATFARDSMRSIQLADLAPLTRVAGVQLISLQKGDAAKQLADQDARILDLMCTCDTLEDTAAIISNLDLVISVDTAVAHLAGAMGKQVWLLNRFSSDWRWGIHGSSSQWYPTMRIFRQPAIRDWKSPVEEMRKVLESMVSQPKGGALAMSPERWQSFERDCLEQARAVERKGLLARWFGGYSDI